MIRWGPVILLLAACGTPQPMCTAKRSGGAFCVPDAGRAANLDVKLQVRDDCTSPCDTGTTSCAVTVDAGSIVLELAGQSCLSGDSCPAVCGIKTYDCTLPALVDGTYTVSSPGNGSASLTVGAGGSASCRLP